MAIEETKQRLGTTSTSGPSLSHGFCSAFDFGTTPTLQT